MFRTILIAILLQASFQQDISPITDLQTLSELPMEKLLKLKHTFDEEPEEQQQQQRTDSESLISAKLKVGNDTPEALALQAKRKTHDRGGYESDHYGKKDYHKKDVNSIFQMTVTTLAFVAFGGYLLCLIVQAIRAKNNADNADNGNMLAMFVRPARPNRIRNSKPSRRPRPGNSRYKREIWPTANPKDMYDALLMLAEGYTKYRTIDYKHFNQTIKDHVRY